MIVGFETEGLLLGLRFLVMAKTGRKTKYTTKTVKTILTVLRDGYTDRVACAQAGISIETYYSWWNQKPEFKRLCHEARNSAVFKVAQHIKNQFVQDWRAAAWWLERTQPEAFGKQSEVVVNNNTTVQVETGVHVDEGKALEMVLAQAKQDEVNRCN